MDNNAKNRIAFKIRGLFGISLLNSIYKSITFGDLLISLSPALLRRYVARARRRQEATVARARQKPTVTVALLLQSPSVWKYGRLYERLEAHPRFRPVVVVTPFNVHLKSTRSEWLRVMRQSEEFARREGYRTVSAYDARRGRWRDIRRELDPDVVFFAKPYKDTLPRYHIYALRDKVTCYQSYGIVNINHYQLNYNLSFHNLLRHYFIETDFQLAFAREHMLTRGANATVTGYLGTEALVDPAYRPREAWKAQSGPRKKRIIWAPHHTIDYFLNFSNFLDLAQPMLDLARRLEGEAQFAFKPHPVLKFKLINLWGADRAEAYYRQWAEGSNTQLAEGDYLDLFLGSDAMVHDCASFTAEYLHTLRPALFVVRDGHVPATWNPFGRQCFDLHYKASDIGGVERFVRSAVLGGDDPLAPARRAFFDAHLAPRGGVEASRRIVDILAAELSPAAATQPPTA